jgi:hypothetical protein
VGALGWIGLVVGAVAIATTVAFVVPLASSRRSTTSPSISARPDRRDTVVSTPLAPANDETCEFEVTDPEGGVHRFGGPRAWTLTDPKRAFILFQRTDRRLVTCTEDFTGRVNQASLELSMPLAEDVDAGADVEDSTVAIVFVGVPPKPFETMTRYTATLAPLLVDYGGSLYPAHRIGTSPSGLPIIHYDGWGKDWDGPVETSRVHAARPPGEAAPITIDWKERTERGKKIVTASIEAKLRVDPTKPVFSLRARLQAIE